MKIGRKPQGRRSGMKTWIVLGLGLMSAASRAEDAVLYDGRQVASVVHEDDRTLQLAGRLLAGDLTRVTGKTAGASADPKTCTHLCVVVGRYDAPLVQTIARDAGVDLDSLKGQWERYARVLVRSRRQPEVSYLLIAGSDTRGAVWGVVDLTRELGVSAWEWWADVTPRRAGRVAVDGGKRLSDAPSVQYRGIFLNDEDWGLQPWAATTHEPEVKDIGPKTYARIFELMWRLKANTLWPAMHDSTRPFYQIPGNAETARDYGIVMGTSHAEPMMRNNVREWDDRTRGPFNFFTNRDAMVRYWAERADEVKAFENIYTIGLRGKHDSGMEGARSPQEARDALTEVFKIQRQLLANAQHKPADQVPQVLTLYKEVLDVYMTGLAVPDDVTLIWPDDNYGYIHQLSTPGERKRKGGAGVYYHISYWGRPHDYLWLGTTHPALIREQMDRAYRMDARKIWILNVGDIKPGEYLSQYFLDLAFDHHAFSQTPKQHLTAWAGRQFGQDAAGEIAAIMMEYYDLAFERRPEFMGGGQTEPVRPNVTSGYVRTGGAEAWRRMGRYADIVRRAEALARRLPGDLQDAYSQLVLYPVRSAANINERILKLDLAATHAKAGSAAGVPHADMNVLVAQARVAHERIVADTAAYNAQHGGKWKGIMDMAPRRLPVFAEPAYPHWPLPSRPECALETADLGFVAGRPATREFTLYSGGQPATWTWSGVRGLQASATGGALNADNGFEQRLRLRYDGAADINAGTIVCGKQTLTVGAHVARPAAGVQPAIGRIVTIPATGASADDWEVVPGLGSMGSALRTRLDLPSTDAGTQRTPLGYAFDNPETSNAVLRIVALPVHPLTSDNGVRLAVSVDGGERQILDFKTVGRSEEWKRNVLSNTAVRTIDLRGLPAGRHRIELYPVDPGFILDRLEIRLDGAPDNFGVPLSN